MFTGEPTYVIYDETSLEQDSAMDHAFYNGIDDKEREKRIEGHDESTTHRVEKDLLTQLEHSATGNTLRIARLDEQNRILILRPGTVALGARFVFNFQVNDKRFKLFSNPNSLLGDPSPRPGGGESSATVNLTYRCPT